MAFHKEADVNMIGNPIYEADSQETFFSRILKKLHFTWVHPTPDTHTYAACFFYLAGMAKVCTLPLLLFYYHYYYYSFIMSCFAAAKTSYLITTTTTIGIYYYCRRCRFYVKNLFCALLHYCPTHFNSAEICAWTAISA